MPLLHTQDLRKEFGGVIAVSGIDIEIYSDSITGIIGPNGAGKTTLFNTITGLDSPTSGYVFFKGEDITELPAYKVTRKGIARTFQNIRLFREMTVFENVMIGRHFKGNHPLITKNKLLNYMLGIIYAKKEEKDIYENSLKWLDFFNLSVVKDEYAGNLPYGRQKQLEIARALATEPEIIFLDEPAAGMNHQETDQLMNTIKKIRGLGITVVLIEHDMKLVMNICDKIIVLNYGRKIAEGNASQIQTNNEVIEAYLGKAHD